MKKCNNCNVQVYESEKICPLCYTKLGESKDSEVLYPQYKNIISEKSPLKHLPLFITATVILICVYINLFTHRPGNVVWSLIVSAAVLFVFAMYNVIKIQDRYGAKIVYGYLCISLLLMAIDFSTGKHLWSTDFVFPFLTLATIVYLTALAVRSKRYFSEYFGFILVVLVISFASVIIYFLGFNNRAWGAFIANMACILIALGLYLFADKNLKTEIKKRFHQ